MTTRGYFITGTDTEVGKTVVAAALLAVLRNAGTDAVPMKPVQTGCNETDGRLVASDLEFCLKTNGLSVLQHEKELMAPYSFEPACSPHLAAEHAGVRIDLERIESAFGRLLSIHDTIVVEGAGGVLVPLSRKETMLDLMIRLGLPVVLVCRTGLGTINHSLLSIDRLRRAGLELTGLVFNEEKPAPATFVEKDNPETIRQFGNVKVLGSLPYCSDIGNLAAAPAKFGEWARKHLRIT